MKLKRAVQLERELASRIRSVYRDTQHFHRSLDDHIEAMKRHVWETDAYRKGPRWMKSYLQGADHVCYQLLYECGPHFKSRELTPEALPPLEWVLVGPDGRRFRENDDSWLKESDEYKLSMSGDSNPSRHVWRKAMDKGEWKPF